MTTTRASQNISSGRRPMRRSTFGLVVLSALALMANPSPSTGQDPTDTLINTLITEAMGHLIGDMLPPSAAEQRTKAQFEALADKIDAGFQKIQETLNKLSAQLAQVQSSVDAQAFNVAHNDLRRSLDLARDYLADLRTHKLSANPLTIAKYAHVVVDLETYAKAYLSRDGLQCAPGRHSLEMRHCRTYADVPLVLQAMLVDSALYYRTNSPPPPKYDAYEEYFTAALDPQTKDSLRYIWTALHKEALAHLNNLDQIASRGQWKCNIFSAHKQDGDRDCRYAIYQPVTGILDNGFCFLSATTEWLEPDECKSKPERDFVHEPIHEPHGRAGHALGSPQGGWSSSRGGVRSDVPASEIAFARLSLDLGTLTHTDSVQRTPAVASDDSGLFTRGLADIPPGAMSSQPACPVQQVPIYGGGQGLPHNTVQYCPGVLNAERESYQRAALIANYAYRLMQYACWGRQLAGELRKDLNPTSEVQVTNCGSMSYVGPVS